MFIGRIDIRPMHSRTMSIICGHIKGKQRISNTYTNRHISTPKKSLSSYLEQGLRRDSNAGPPAVLRLPKAGIIPLDHEAFGNTEIYETIYSLI